MGAPWGVTWGCSGNSNGFPTYTKNVMWNNEFLKYITYDFSKVTSWCAVTQKSYKNLNSGKWRHQTFYWDQYCTSCLITYRTTVLYVWNHYKLAVNYWSWNLLFQRNALWFMLKFNTALILANQRSHNTTISNSTQSCSDVRAFSMTSRQHCVL